MAANVERWIEQAGLLHDAGRLGEAEELYRRVLDAEPGRTQAMCGLGVLLSQTGRHGEAVLLLRWEVVWKSGSALLLTALGASLGGIGKFEEGIACARRVVEILPGNATGHFNLGCVLAKAGRWEAAAEAYRAAIGAELRYAEAWQNLGFSLRELKQWDGAIAAFEMAVRFRADYAEAMHNLGVSLGEVGRVSEGVDWLRRALEIAPGNTPAHSGLVYLMEFDPRATASALVAEERRWGERHAALFKREWRDFAGERAGEAERKLKIGYMSPDFRSHAECRFMLPLLEQHDRRGFEVHLFSSVTRPDEMTVRMRGLCDRWHECAGMSDAALAEKIRAEGIDILVDLTMHMENGRPLVLVRKPAPVQMVWLAYPGGTGIEGVDWRITDRYLDPVEHGDGGHVEKALRLGGDGSWFCYQGAEDAPGVGGGGALPALSSGVITFGSLNTFRKMSEGVADLWGRMMKAVGDAGRRCRLLMVCPAGAHREGVMGILASQGIRPEQIELVAPLKYAEYLAAYGRIDIGLDPFPHNGATTTCDALWMGVPVLSLRGRTHVGRLGLSVLGAAGMPEWVARDEAEFIAKAVAFSGDLARLSALRAALRERVRGSALMDAVGFARRMEGAFRWAWAQWIAVKSPRERV